jgi:predicted DNA-binding transcriptional regulator AlpA
MTAKSTLRIDPRDQARAVAWLDTDVADWQRAVLVAAGGDPAKIPKPSTPRFLRRPAVLERTGLTTSTLYRMMSRGTFPRPHRIDQGAPL